MGEAVVVRTQEKENLFVTKQGSEGRRHGRSQKIPYKEELFACSHATSAAILSDVAKAKPACLVSI